VKITLVEPESIAAEIGLRPGDDLLEVNGRKILDSIDYRFHEHDEEISLKVARASEVMLYDIEKEEGERLGLDFEEMKILSCGNDCIFCFVDQNPRGLRNQVYFRDGDYRLSFMYGNYTTMTNAGPAILRRIIDQRLSPQYISVHVTDYAIRKELMGLKKDDRILEKIALLHDHGIDMHTQIVLCPGINDGGALQRTVRDLYRFRRHILSLAIVPVGLTDHRFGLVRLDKVDAAYAQGLLDFVAGWQKEFRPAIGRGFVYPSDEFFITAGCPIPPSPYYDGFPQTENGVGMVRSFLDDFRKQSRRFPRRLAHRREIVLVSGELAGGIMDSKVVPVLRQIGNLDVRLEVLPNTLFGRSVTVAGLLSGKCIVAGLTGNLSADLVILPPDIRNADGLLLDDMNIPDLEGTLGCDVLPFDGHWPSVFDRLSMPAKPALQVHKSDHI
jgi:putative radical SAM enzyme (TIGR03279 family)